MGLCISNSKSPSKYKEKGAELCGHIQFGVSPILTNEPLESEAKPKNHSEFVRTYRGMAEFFNRLREVVSAQRVRYLKDGFNLDLTYIRDDIIAMGLPASRNFQRKYRNDIREVGRFLNEKHPDSYHIFNLCAEERYPTEIFHGRVTLYPFQDHNPPLFQYISLFCEEVHRYLTDKKNRVVAVHCKAGKGRTGMMIACYLLHSHVYETADEALMFYALQRTYDAKGVTIPSQIRYVHYYEKALREELAYTEVVIQINEIILRPPPKRTCVLCVSHQIINEDNSLRTVLLYHNPEIPVRSDADQLRVKIMTDLLVKGDVKVQVFVKKMGMNEKFLKFWFNNFFLVREESLVDLGKGKWAYTLAKHELDELCKKDDQFAPPNFQVQMIFTSGEVGPLRKAAEETAAVAAAEAAAQARILARDIPTEPSDHEWDSGDSTYL